MRGAPIETQENAELGRDKDLERGDALKNVEAVICGTLEWCEAVARDQSWDGWDHHWKAMCRLMESMGLPVRDEDASRETECDLTDETRAKIRKIIAALTNA